MLFAPYALAPTTAPLERNTRTLLTSTSLIPTRSALPDSGLKSATFEMWMGMVLSIMPPCEPAIGLAFTCFLTTLMPSTNTWSASTRCNTVPRRFLSRPANTMTSSPLRIFCMVRSLQHFWSQRHDLHELFCTQFARDRAEDTGTEGFQFGDDQHGSVATELDQRAVFTTNALSGANHYSVVNLALFDAPAWGRIFDTNFDNVTDSGITALRAA